MVGFRVAGALWILAGVICLLLLIVVFVGENLALPALVTGGAIVSLLIGVRLIARPGPAIVRWSNVAGVAWLMVFGSLVVTRLDEPGPRTSSALITGFGVAGALVAFLSRRAARPV